MSTSMTLPIAFAPARYSFDYLFAITLAAQPLADGGFEPARRGLYYGISAQKYQPLQLRFHQGVILPVGEEPSGRSWTGFQSTVSGTQGYLVVYREDNETSQGTLTLGFLRVRKLLLPL